MSCACKTAPAPAPASAPATELIGADTEDAGCSGGEAFALRVLGDDMVPEFNHGEIIVIEPGGALRDGSFVLAQVEGEWTFRQLCQREGQWLLHALNPQRVDQPLADLSAVHGVVIQKAVPGRRKLTKFYV